MQRKHGHRLAARRKAAGNVTYLLYGTASRDPLEQVGMLFEDPADLWEFAKALPGCYRFAALVGVDYNAFDFEYKCQLVTA